MAISLEDAKLSFVHGRYASSGKPAIARYGTAEIESKPNAAEKLVRDLRLDRYQCETLLRAGEYQMLVVEAPTVPQAELKSALRWRIKDMIDYHLDDATMDVLDIPPGSDLVGRSHSMYAVTARNEVIQGRIKAFEDAGIPLGVIDIPEIAQRNISALHEPEERGAALLYFNNEFGLLTITCQGELYLARRIEIGLSQIRGRPAELRDELFGRIVLELQRSFDHFDRQFHYVSIAKMLLGPEPEETGLFDHLKGNIDFPLERVDLADRLAFNGQGVPDAATQWQLFHLIGASLRHEAKAL
ncbi:MAG: agglutinin biogenesis protein MshI [Betaproteobacteria bacterium]|nr:agglutinin biogenesis protein MshI [Betaproteobacteria bacterium]